MSTNDREVARRIAVDCESAYSGIGWSGNDTDDLTDAITKALTTARREQAERVWKEASSIVEQHFHKSEKNDSRWNAAILSVAHYFKQKANEDAAAIRAAAKEGEQ